MVDMNNRQRQQDELDLLSAAYSVEEVWWEYAKDDTLRVYRKLFSQLCDPTCCFCLILQMEVPSTYPEERPLQVTAQVDDSLTSKAVLKLAHDSVPSLVNLCRTEAESMLGSEAMWTVLSRAQEWMTDELPGIIGKAAESSFVSTESKSPNKSSHSDLDCNTQRIHSILLGRRLIYSHHIISTKKRSDMRQLASELHLTGYVKIGWPGIIILEGLEDDCQTFYDTIRRWNWQYLVVRGEMQETVDESKERDHRCFDSFCEVEDMSIVANHCKKVGLEALFRTSMKVYENRDETTDTALDDADDDLYGALIYVDHMNDGKNYRKWLRKASDDLSLGLIIKECSSTSAFKNVKNSPPISPATDGRPIMIVVAVVGYKAQVGSFLKKWRTTRVDVDSKGKPCLERMMTVLRQEPLKPLRALTRHRDWQQWNAEEHVQISSFNELEVIFESIGGASWVEALQALWKQRI